MKAKVHDGFLNSLLIDGRNRRQLQKMHLRE